MKNCSNCKYFTPGMSLDEYDNLINDPFKDGYCDFNKIHSRWSQCCSNHTEKPRL